MYLYFWGQDIHLSDFPPPKKKREGGPEDLVFLIHPIILPKTNI